MNTKKWEGLGVIGGRDFLKGFLENPNLAEKSNFEERPFIASLIDDTPSFQKNRVIIDLFRIKTYPGLPQFSRMEYFAIIITRC